MGCLEVKALSHCHQNFLFMSGQLCTDYFLCTGIRHTPEWVAQEHTFESFLNDIRKIYVAFDRYHDPNESVTKQDIILPILELLV